LHLLGLKESGLAGGGRWQAVIIIIMEGDADQHHNTHNTAQHSTAQQQQQQHTHSLMHPAHQITTATKLSSLVSPCGGITAIYSLLSLPVS
jgi:hypothetical protein